jgi:anti-anti-sigma factor
MSQKQGEAMLAIDFGANGTVVINGRLDAAQCPVAQSFLDRVDGTVTLDCAGLEYVSSAGLGVLLKTQKRLKASSGKLRLVGVNGICRTSSSIPASTRFSRSSLPDRPRTNFRDRRV